MIILDALLAIVFALLATYYGMRASRQRKDGDPRARWSALAAVLLGFASVAWAVSLVIQAA